MTDPPNGEELTPLDLSMPRTYIRVLLVFEKADPRLHLTRTLQCGLDKLSKQLPWLSGRVFPTTPTQDRASRLEIRWNADHPPALVDKGSIATAYKSSSSHGIPAEDIPSCVWPVSGMIDEALFSAGAPVFAASIFRFVDHGVGLCVCLHHNAVDGTGLSDILRLWARNVAEPGFTFASPPQNRSARLAKALSFDLQETSCLPSERLFSLHPEYSKLPPAVPKVFPSCTSKLFTISIHWINVLKELLCKYTVKAPTTNTLVCALLWTTITRVRMLRTPALGDESSRLVTAVNGRHRIGERFSGPEHPYFGNAVLYSLAKFPARALAGADEDSVHSLARICDHISQSQSTLKVNARHVAEVCHLVYRTENSGSLFVGWDLFGSRDLVITSWADLDLYGLNFGAVLGRPSFVRLTYMEADGVALILPRQRAVANELLEMMILLRREDMDALETDTLWQTVASTVTKGGNDVEGLKSAGAEIKQ